MVGETQSACHETGLVETIGVCQDLPGEVNHVVEQIAAFSLTDDVIHYKFPL